MKKIGVILSILTVLTLSFITNNNVSAVSDVVYTIDSSSSTTSLCNNSTNSQVKCSDFNYIYITYSGSSVKDRLSISLYPSQNDPITVNYSTFTSSTELSSLFEIRAYPGLSTISSGSSFTITLSENNPAGGITPEGTLDVVANGTYDVTNYASVDVQVEESSFIVQLFSQGFWGVATAIVTIIVPIIALFLIFRLVHDLLWGRG